MTINNTFVITKFIFHVYCKVNSSEIWSAYGLKTFTVPKFPVYSLVRRQDMQYHRQEDIHPIAHQCLQRGGVDKELLSIF